MWTFIYIYIYICRFRITAKQKWSTKEKESGRTVRAHEKVQCFVDGCAKLFRVDVLDFDIVTNNTCASYIEFSLWWILSNGSKWQVVFRNVHVVNISTLYWDTSFGNFTIFMWRHREKVFIMFDTVYMWQADKLKTGTRTKQQRNTNTNTAIIDHHRIATLILDQFSHCFISTIFEHCVRLYMLVQQISRQKTKFRHIFTLVKQNAPVEHPNQLLRIM